jgi:hypothetical protein
MSSSMQLKTKYKQFQVATLWLVLETSFTICVYLV